ncbi:MAG TPA: PQQ-binding-like beta-propeller repeat protein, partial [Acidimicrobiales bacterium]|nr:PQQ-binding-like beta-propeller repeat protein [Acidimicrobiales bacterium]
AALAGMALGLSGCWLQPDFDAGNSNWNGGESELTTATVGELTQLWSSTAIADTGSSVIDPVATGGGVYVTAGDGPEGTTPLAVAALETATGDLRWRTDLPGSGDQYASGIALDEGAVVVPFYTTGTGLYGPWPVGGGRHDLVASTGAITSSSTTASQLDIALWGGAVITHRSAFPEVPIEPVPQLPGATMIHGGPFQPIIQEDLSVFGPPRGIGPFAVVADRIAWSDGLDAQGFSAACPPRNTTHGSGCGPDWSTDLGGYPDAVAAVGVDGVAYTHADDGVVRMTVLDVVTGAVRWRAELGPGRYSAHAPLVVTDTTILVGVDRQVVALPVDGCGATECAALWRTPEHENPDIVHVTAAADVAYVAASDGTIEAFPLAGCGAATCQPLATVDAGSEISGGPIVHDGRVFVGTVDGRVVAFGLPD